MSKVAYIHRPKVKIRNQCNVISSKRVDLPHIVLQIFDVAEVQD